MSLFETNQAISQNYANVEYIEQIWDMGKIVAMLTTHGTVVKVSEKTV